MLYYKSSALFVQSCGNLHWRFVCMTLVQSKLIKWIPSRPNDSNQSRANVVSHFCFYRHRKWNITRYFWGFTTHAFEMLPAAVLMLFTNFIQDTDDCTKITSSFSTGHGLPILSTQANWSTLAIWQVCGTSPNSVIFTCLVRKVGNDVP